MSFGSGRDSIKGLCWLSALLDEAALLSCMAYVDLNPIRANMAETPESSAHTSIKRRITGARDSQQPKELLAFIGNEHQGMPKGLSFHLKDYVELVDQTGRILREDKRGCISGNAVSILSRLNLPVENWITLTRDFEKLFTGPVGTVQRLDTYSRSLERRRSHGRSSCRALFG